MANALFLIISDMFCFSVWPFSCFCNFDHLRMYCLFENLCSLSKHFQKSEAPFRGLIVFQSECSLYGGPRYSGVIECMLHVKEVTDGMCAGGRGWRCFGDFIRKMQSPRSRQNASFSFQSFDFWKTFDQINGWEGFSGPIAGKWDQPCMPAWLAMTN